MGETTSTVRLDRANLLLYHDDTGAIKTGTSITEWEKRRGEILDGMQEVTGKLPGNDQRVPLDVIVEEEVDCGSYLRRQITYASEPKCRTPAFLLIPKSVLNGETTAPAVLALHSTERNLGSKVAVGLGGTKNRDYGRQLAERGFVVLAPTYPMMGGYNVDLKKLGYAGGVMKAVWDNIRGLDYLGSLPGVKHGNYGVIGHSLGGHNSIFTAVYDDRIKVVVSSCGFDSFVDYMDGDLTAWQQELYMPRLAGYNALDVPFDFYGLIGALAPRVVFISAPTRDANFKWQSVDRIVKSASVIYGLYGKSENLQVVHPDCAHDVPNAVLEQAMDILAKNLK